MATVRNNVCGRYRFRAAVRPEKTLTQVGSDQGGLPGRGHTHTLSPTARKQEKAAASRCHVAGSEPTQVLLVPSTGWQCRKQSAYHPSSAMRCRLFLVPQVRTLSRWVKHFLLCAATKRPGQSGPKPRCDQGTLLSMISVFIKFLFL